MGSSATRFVVAILLSTCLPIGCSAGAATAPQIPGTHITLEQAIFLPGRDTRFDVSRSGIWRICRSSDYAEGTQLGLLTIILAEERLLRLGNPPDCEVVISRVDQYQTSSSDFVHDAYGCRFVFSQRQGVLRSVRLTPSPFSAEQYEKCVLRLGLFLTGYNGVLAISDVELFVPYDRSVWASFSSHPRFVPIFQFNITACEVDPARIFRRRDMPRNFRCRTF